MPVHLIVNINNILFSSVSLSLCSTFSVAWKYHVVSYEKTRNIIMYMFHCFSGRFLPAVFWFGDVTLDSNWLAGRAGFSNDSFFVEVTCIDRNQTENSSVH